MMEQVGLCAVWTKENWLNSFLNQIQDWTTVRLSYFCASEQVPLPPQEAVTAKWPCNNVHFLCARSLSLRKGREGKGLGLVLQHSLRSVDPPHHRHLQITANDLGASIYDVRTEWRGESRNTPNLRTNNVSFADREGRGGPKMHQVCGCHIWKPLLEALKAGER